MSEKIELDTTIREPEMTAGEVEMLRFVLDRSRAQFAWKVGGLDADALRRQFPPSAMTIGGIVKHMALNEDWMATRLTGWPMPRPWTEVDWDNDPEWPWHSAAADTPAGLYALWARAADRLREAMAAVVADGGLDRPAKIPFESGDLPNARRLLADLHDEYARHVGHVDLFREAVDGLVGEDPPQPDRG